MAFIASTPLLGEVDLTAVDISGPGPSALVGANAGKAGRNSFYAEILEGYDPALGGAEFMYVQAAIAIAPGQVVQISCGQDGGNNFVMQATPWTGTAYAGQELAVAIAAIGTGQWGWVQIGGFAVVNFGGTTAGQTISGITINGAVATVTTASAHGLAVGQEVTLSGQAPSAYAGSYVVTSAPSTTTFTYALAVTNLPATSATTVGSYTYYSGSVAGQTVSSGAASGTTCTLTTGSAHNLQVGSVVTVSGATPAAYNGTVTVTAVGSSTTFSYVAASAPGGATSVQPSYTVTGQAANGQAYYTASGAISPVLVAGKHVVGAQFAASTGATVGSGSTARTLPAWQAVLYVGRPNSQGSNT